jgi:hypothetical protein
MESAMENVTTGTPSNSGFSPRKKLAGKNRRSPKLIGRLYDYAMGNLISVISIFWTSLGGLTILIYLIGESYFPPDINASSIGLLLAAAALIGILLTIIFGLYFILPGFIYRHILADNFKEDSIKLLSDRAIGLLLDVPAVAVAAIFLFYLKIDTKSTLSFFSLLIFIFLVLVSVLFATACAYPRTNSIEKENRCKWWKAYFVVGVSAILAAIPWLLILQLAIGYSRNGADDFHVLFAIAGMSVVVVISNHVIARVEKMRVILIVSFAVLFVALILTRQINLIPRMVVHVLTIGDIRNAALQLDEQGCQIAMQYSSLIPDVEKNAPTKKKKHEKPAVCTLSSTTIAWRIGNEYLIDATETTDKNNKIIKSELGFEVAGKNQKAECVQSKPVSLQNKCKSPIVEDTETEPTFLRFTLNSKFTLPASHVLSWEAKKAEVAVMK